MDQMASGMEYADCPGLCCGHSGGWRALRPDIWSLPVKRPAPCPVTVRPGSPVKVPHKFFIALSYTMSEPHGKKERKKKTTLQLGRKNV